jgi:hypothetical protein
MECITVVKDGGSGNSDKCAGCVWSGMDGITYQDWVSERTEKVLDD